MSEQHTAEGDVARLTDKEIELREWLRSQPGGAERWTVVKAGFRRSYDMGMRDSLNTRPDAEKYAGWTTVPNPDQPGRCPSIDPHDTLQCERSIHEDDQCQCGGIAWRKGTPRYVSAEERLARIRRFAESKRTTAADERPWLDLLILCGGSDA